MIDMQAAVIDILLDTAGCRIVGHVLAGPAAIARTAVDTAEARHQLGEEQAADYRAMRAVAHMLFEGVGGSMAVVHQDMVLEPIQAQFVRVWRICSWLITILEEMQGR